MFKVLIDGLWSLLNITINVEGYELKVYYFPIFFTIIKIILHMIYGEALKVLDRQQNERKAALKTGEQIISKWKSSEDITHRRLG